MKEVIASTLILFSALPSWADFNCRLFYEGVDQGDAISVRENGTCERGNGYHVAYYTLTVSDDKAVFTCINKFQHSWFPAALEIEIRDGQAKMKEYDRGQWRQGSEIRCR